MAIAFLFICPAGGTPAIRASLGVVPDVAFPPSNRKVTVLAGTARRLAVLKARDFRIFYIGYVTSVLGSAMSPVAIAFAVLDHGGSATDLGFVLAAGVTPQLAFMVVGGVIADRLGRRPVMLAADTVRFLAQSTLAIMLFVSSPPLALFVALNGLLGTGEAFFTPSLTTLTVDIAPADLLSDANALFSLAQSCAKIAGPALAGILVAVTSPAVVIAVDAATYAVSVVTLVLIRPPASDREPQSPLRDIGEGWREFRSRPWLLITTLQYSLVNLITWAPYLLLGPVLAKAYLGGAKAWGAIATANAVGSIVAGALAVGRRPRRPLLVATLATVGIPAPCFFLALRAPLAAVAAGAAVAGAAWAISNTFWTTVLQHQVPRASLTRVTAFSLTGSFVLGTAGYAIIGPIAAVVGTGHLLAVAAIWGVVSTAAVTAAPSIKSVT